MNIGPNISDRLSETLQIRIDDFDAEALHLLDIMIVECRSLGAEGLPSYIRLADRLEEFKSGLKLHPPRSDQGKEVRQNLIQVSKELGEMFDGLATLSTR